MWKSGFVLPPVLLAVIAVIIIGGSIAFVASSRSENEKGEREESTRDVAPSLETLEHEAQLAAESGGMTPEAFERIVSELDRLAEQGISPTRIQTLRALLATIDVGGSKAVRAAPPSPTVPTPSPQTRPPSNEKQPPRNVPISSSLPLYDRTVCPESSEGDDVFVRSGVQYRVDDEVRRWAEEFCGPNAKVPLVPPPPPEPTGPPQPSGPPQRACESNPSPVFTNHITDMSKVNYIVPPPTIGAGPSLKPHSYIGTDHARVPVYAPAAMTLESGSHYVGGPYMMEFRVSCEVKVRFGHITEPVEAIKNLLPAEAKQDSRTEVLPPVTFAAGDLIAHTTGTSAAGNWDFGVYNSEKPNRYASDPTWNWSDINTTGVCPFAYFTGGLKSAYVSKFNASILGGNPPDGESFCAGI